MWLLSCVLRLVPGWGVGVPSSRAAFGPCAVLPAAFPLGLWHGKYRHEVPPLPPCHGARGPLWVVSCGDLLTHVCLSSMSGRCRGGVCRGTNIIYNIYMCAVSYSLLAFVSSCPLFPWRGLVALASFPNNLFTFGDSSGMLFRRFLRCFAGKSLLCGSSINRTLSVKIW